jgi:hypothetical protein
LAAFLDDEVISESYVRDIAKTWYNSCKVVSARTLRIREDLNL